MWFECITSGCGFATNSPKVAADHDCMEGHHVIVDIDFMEDVDV